MGEHSSDFHEALVELVDQTYPEPAGHPSPERWLAYHRGELDAGEEARLAEHLVRCRDCFDLAQAAEAFAGPAEEPAAGEAVESAALWRLLRPRLQEARESPAAATPRRAFRNRLPLALAASFFVGLLGMAAWNLQQQSALARLRAPRPNAPIHYFSAGERLPLPEEKPLAASSAPWMFVIQPAGELSAYRLVIREAATGRVRSSHVLRPDEDSALTLYLPELPPGRYRLEILDASGGGAGPVLEEHLLRVTEAGRGD